VSVSAKKKLVGRALVSYLAGQVLNSCYNLWFDSKGISSQKFWGAKMFDLG